MASLAMGNTFSLESSCLNQQRLIIQPYIVLRYGVRYNTGRISISEKEGSMPDGKVASLWNKAYE